MKAAVSRLRKSAKFSTANIALNTRPYQGLGTGALDWRLHEPWLKPTAAEFGWKAKILAHLPSAYCFPWKTCKLTASITSYERTAQWRFGDNGCLCHWVDGNWSHWFGFAGGCSPFRGLAYTAFHSAAPQPYALARHRANCHASSWNSNANRSGDICLYPNVLPAAGWLGEIRCQSRGRFDYPRKNSRFKSGTNYGCELSYHCHVTTRDCHLCASCCDSCANNRACCRNAAHISAFSDFGLRSASRVDRLYGKIRR